MRGFIKNWTLPLAMGIGVLVYFIFSSLPFLNPVKPLGRLFVQWLTPMLIFAQLLITFCKIETGELFPRPWVWWLLLCQGIGALLLAVLLVYVPLSSYWRILLEGVLVCVVCPTATAAAVVTGKLGGNAAVLTTYTLLSNLQAAVLVPFLFPLVEATHVCFVESFLSILGRVFPLLIFPFVVACLLRYFLPAVHGLISGCKDLAFYLWAVALVIVMAQTTESVFEGETSWEQEAGISVCAFVICVLQFAVGRWVGGCYLDRISGGQALGQKNTILAIWMAGAYLSPLSALAPGSYVLWQNIINSYQLWRKNEL